MAAPSRRPSLFARARQGHSSVVASPAGARAPGQPRGAGGNGSSSGGNPAPLPDAEFQKKVNKLADLLPHADRAVLAGYLRRAGEDILAIGQYIEDEKNGCLRRD